jgi:hypothetical protein
LIFKILLISISETEIVTREDYTETTSTRKTIWAIPKCRASASDLANISDEP